MTETHLTEWVRSLRRSISPIGMALPLLAIACGGKIDTLPKGGTPATQATTGTTQIINQGPYSLGAGEQHSCALVAGVAHCWGGNPYGQMGSGTLTSSLVPVQVQNLPLGASAVSAGTNHTCAIVTGSVYCWGRNTNLQLGLTGSTLRTLPTPVPALSNSVMVLSASNHHTCAIATGAASCWGSNAFRQLAAGLIGDSELPVSQPSVASGATGVSAGSMHSCAIAFGNVSCWGSNFRGQLGDGTTNDRSGPIQVIGLSGNATSVGAGEMHSCALVDGGVFCWGANDQGQLGTRTTGGVYGLAPALVPGMDEGVTLLDSGDNHNCAIRDGLLYCWGDNRYGQIGVGPQPSSTVTQPVAVDLPHGVTDVVAGMKHTCARVATRVFCWGDNSYGQLGNGSKQPSHKPVEVQFP